MRGKIHPKPPWPAAGIETVTRACLKIGSPIIYGLEYPNGGNNPDADGPEDHETKRCDCIGFVAWCDGWDRFNPKFPLYGGWINTDSMIEDADGGKAFFETLAGPELGCFIVGHTYELIGGVQDGHRVIGHIGVVTKVGTGMTDTEVVHCSPGNYRYTDHKSAIWRTNATLWNGYRRHRWVRLRDAVRASPAATSPTS